MFRAAILSTAIVLATATTANAWCILGMGNTCPPPPPPGPTVQQLLDYGLCVSHANIHRVINRSGIPVCMQINPPPAPGVCEAALLEAEAEAEIVYAERMAICEAMPH